MAGDQGGQKRKFDNARQQFGSRNKKKELGRGAWSRQKGDKRAQIEEQGAKRRKLEENGEKNDGKPSLLPAPYSEEEIAQEERKPKHKVAVLIGYSGTGYRGMQINTTERTIEGDLFTAFVRAGAISKANANDPKKSGLVRCARTDKGVHAAGNVVSLKLIVEDPNVVENINSHLSEQIRVWGILRTVGSFSCYQACDSRWYEYLIPSHAFLPPHPNSFLGRKLVEVAEEMGQLDAYNERQAEVSTFWQETEEKYIKPVVDKISNATVKELVMKALYEPEETSLPADDEPSAGSSEPTTDAVPTAPTPATNGAMPEADDTRGAHGGSVADLHSVPAAENAPEPEAADRRSPADPDIETSDAPTLGSGPVTTTEAGAGSVEKPEARTEATTNNADDLPSSRLSSELRREIETTTRTLRGAYTAAKRSHRISSARLARVQETLDQYLGTQNYHNFTVNKTPGDPSAKRHIKSFTLDKTPKIINGTEWLSLKVHGQSFMMHQIRKMVSACALVVRCGCPPSRIKETLSPDANVSIPKAPGLGLLLERPVFESYNANTAAKYERDPLVFDKFEKEMEEFKQREIYERIFREEESSGQFGTFFGHIDGFREGYFLWVTAKGVEASRRDIKGGNEGARASQHFKKTGANAESVGPRKAGSSGEQLDGATKSNTSEKSKHTMGGVDSEDEEDAEEAGRADMDG